MRLGRWMGHVTRCHIPSNDRVFVDTWQCALESAPEDWGGPLMKSNPMMRIIQTSVKLEWVPLRGILESVKGLDWLWGVPHSGKKVTSQTSHERYLSIERSPCLYKDLQNVLDLQPSVFTNKHLASMLQDCVKYIEILMWYLQPYIILYKLTPT